MLDRYDEIDHYEGRDFFSGNKGTPVYTEDVLKEKYGEKKIISVDSFVLMMLNDCNGLKYMYEETIEGCLLHVSHTKWVKCKEPPSKVIERFREAYSQLCKYHLNGI